MKEVYGRNSLYSERICFRLGPAQGMGSESFAKFGWPCSEKTKRNLGDCGAKLWSVASRRPPPPSPDFAYMHALIITPNLITSHKLATHVRCSLSTSSYIQKLATHVLWLVPSHGELPLVAIFIHRSIALPHRVPCRSRGPPPDHRRHPSCAVCGL